MCGIVGILKHDRAPVDVHVLAEMARRLRHRGPDDEGYLLASTHTGRQVPCGGADTMNGLDLPDVRQFQGHVFDLGFGFRRLAILDRSAAGHQPMASADRNLWIVLNGEIYNYLELRQELKGYGHEFHTQTDTEVVLAAYQQWGPECLQRFNGMWGLAIWSNSERRLFLARDRFGVKPVYYVQRGATFTFASEIKALVGSHGQPFEPDEGTVYRYLAGGLLPNARTGQTFFAGVHALPPGHWLIVQPGAAATVHRYWSLSLDETDTPERDAADVVSEYRDLFIDAVRLRLRADVPVGTCLSGGLDSSSIVCVLNRLMSGSSLNAKQTSSQQKTFSAVYDTEGPFNERVHIDKVLHATGAEANFTVPSSERLRMDLERLIWHQDEPFSSTSIFAQWCVMSSVRERGVTVLLDGQGADEVLGGYRPFVITLAEFLGRMQLSRAWAEARDTQATTGLARGGLLIKALAHQMPDVGLQLLRHVRSATKTDFSGMNPDFVTAQRRNGPADWMSPTGERGLSNHLLTLLEETSLPHLLRYEDRNSMAFGVEARVPFLDYRLVQYAFNSAAKWRIRNGWTKWIQRQAMHGIVPEEIAWRKDKVGFETPEADWLRRWTVAGLHMFGSEAQSTRFLDVRSINDNLSKSQNSRMISSVWRWINLEMWLRMGQTL